jgi:2-keto-3-deoxy-L-rhamnonate aldolase RhmA
MSILDETIALKADRPLMGLACSFHDPVLVEIAAYLDYDVVWIEMEHAHITFAQAADLCRIGSGLGMLTMIRIPDARRENVLKAAECGPDIIDLPMVNSPEIAAELVAHARYTPEGSRGFFGSSRAVRYSACGTIVEEQQRINRHLCLMGQIETREAVENADAVCATPGLDAILLGPGDMSTSLGVVGQVNHPLVHEAFGRAIVAAKTHGKKVAVVCAPSEIAGWFAQGVHLFFCGNDISCMKAGAKAILDEARESVTG